jgi:hypothetical protein
MGAHHTTICLASIFIFNPPHWQGLHVTLNLHPADGVHKHEDAYPAVCAAMGRPADGTAVPFDITDKAYVDAYFKYLHHPIERQGGCAVS